MNPQIGEIVAEMRAYSRHLAVDVEVLIKFADKLEALGGCDAANAERYLHLRSGKRDSMDAPYVMNIRGSRLYAMDSYKDSILDTKVDADILDCKAKELRTEFELDHRANWPDQEYSDALYEFTRQKLGWTIERYKAAVGDDLNVIAIPVPPKESCDGL